MIYGTFCARRMTWQQVPMMMTAMVRLCSRQYCERERTFSIVKCFIYCIKVEKIQPFKLELIAGLDLVLTVPKVPRKRGL